MSRGGNIQGVVHLQNQNYISKDDNVMNEPIFSIADHLCGEITSHKMLVMRSYDVFDSGLRTGLFNIKLHMEILHQDYIAKQY